MEDPKKTEVWEETKKQQEETGDKPDSNKQFREAEHQAREDAQEAGELPEREANKEAQQERENEESPDKKDE